MKLVTYRQGNESRSGLLVGENLDRVVDLVRALGYVGHRVDGRSVLGLVEAGADGLDAGRKVLAAHAEKKLPEVHAGGPTTIDAAAVTLLSPIPRPPSMRDGYAFRQHVETARRNRGLEMIPEFDQFPVFYFTNHQAVVGPGPVHVKPRHLERLDFELEAAVVVGAEARDLSAANADDVIFGMTIMNDFSARALQMDEMKLSLGPAKGKDFATGLGPYLVTMDELASFTETTASGARFDLGMRAFVNGVQVSTGNVKDMTWTFAQILERASYGVTLYPGDVVGSGTCGTGCFLELNGSKITNNQWLMPGDVVALEIDQLGRLENRIVAS
ncbi:MAG TPA: fumarylacetoacetate hydrolase family protein [Labilithrix sp.]|nr:fumarylacetoacetate hydrolase family protein [Labilithrix sp.]